MCAAKILNAEGIRTLGTCLFSLPQAIAASQAGCLYISPYFNGEDISLIRRDRSVLNAGMTRLTFSFQRSELTPIDVSGPTRMTQLQSTR